MAGPSNYIPTSESYSPSYLETLVQDNQPNLLADFSNNELFSYSSLLSYNPLEAYIPPSTSVLNVPTSPPRIQNSTPLITIQEAYEADPSRRPVKRCRNMAELMESTKPTQPRNPSPSPAKTTNPFLCSCCHVLREIIHTNGSHHQKLEVHGRIGMICHAVHHKNVQEGPSATNNLQMFDFEKKNIEEIKYFLIQYCLKQSASGYDLVPDPLSAYYEALCVGLEWTETRNELFNSSFPVNTENMSTKGKEIVVVDDFQDDYSTSKPGEAFQARLEQQLRGEAMSLKDLCNFFHLTLEETSRELNMGVNTIKKICFRGGLINWPHRSLVKLMKKVAALRRALPRQNPILREITLEKIKGYQQEMVGCCNGVVPTVAFES